MCGGTKMREIISVTGPVSPDELGFCQFHEHLMISRGKSYEVNPDILMDEPQKSLEEVKRYQAVGGMSIIDAQPGGCTRMAEGLAEISRQTGVHIICSTGFHKMLFYPEDHWIHRIDEDALYAYYKRELTQGTTDESDVTSPDGCSFENVRAGIVKCALDSENLTPRYQRLFLAAARAAAECEKTMLIHVEAGSDPIRLLDFLQGTGLRPERLVFCHMDRAIPDLAVHKQILASGAYLEFDTIGRFKYHSDEEEIAIFQELIREGYEKQLLFSLDTTRARMRAYDPAGIGLDYILTDFLPKMMYAGITKEQINRIAKGNAVCALCG